MSSSSPTERTAPTALWRVAQAFLTTLFQLFGGPEAVAERHTLTQKPYALLLGWLRAGEALMRRLLLIEAMAYPNVPARGDTHAWQADRHLDDVQRDACVSPRKRRLMEFRADKPEEWRVSFRCFSSRDRGRPRPHSSARRRCAVPGFRSAWPLAERYEALLRVFNDPAPYARRLAARLHATPHRANEMLAYPPDAPSLVGAEAFASTDPPAHGAVHHFSSA